MHQLLINISVGFFKITFVFYFQEVDPSVIEKESPYLLFFERDGINVSDYLPDVKNANLDVSSDDDEFETDVKKYCVIQ